MEISKGMYIRTKYGISRIVEFHERKNNLSCYYLDKNIMEEEKYFSNCIYGYKYYTDQILKASFNLIDLIEVGDYVNGEKVTSAESVDKNDTDRYLGFGDYNYYIHDNEDIKDIVTKEQFNACKYVVERDKQMNTEILNKYIELINKGYCEDCNELNCIGNFPHKEIAKNIKDILEENQELKQDIKNLVHIINHNCLELETTKEEYESLKRWQNK